MRLLIAANSFYPSVGGYERVALMLAEGLAMRGHDVKVITFSAGKSDDQFLFGVCRNPTAATIMDLIRWCDVYVQNNVSLRLLWPVALVRKPVVFIHHGFYRNPRETLLAAWKGAFKHWLTTMGAINISVSQAVAAELPTESKVIVNPYKEDLFFRRAEVMKRKDLVFVGRMVPDKGVDVLLDALVALRRQGLRLGLTLVGSGPQELALRQKVHQLELEQQVSFVGWTIGTELSILLNEHKVLIVPSREGEGFGVVALEGIACGCLVVASSHGGLPEAVGPCGRIFENGDPLALAHTIFDLFERPESWSVYLDVASGHLARHKPAAVMEKYERELIDVFSNFGHTH